MPRPLLALALVPALLLAGVPAASAAYTVRTKEGAITRIGPMKTVGVNGGRVMDATAAFGPASSIAPIGPAGSEACRIRWRALKLRATFANFGTGDPCGAETGRLQLATVRSRRFRTRRGLRVGDRSATIAEKHPRARFRRNRWIVSRTRSPFGDPGRIPTIEAFVRDGRVEILRLWVGAAGD